MVILDEGSAGGSIIKTTQVVLIAPGNRSKIRVAEARQMFSGDHGRLKVIPQPSFRAVPKLTTRLFFGVRPATESVLSSESLNSPQRRVICHSDTLQFTHHQTAPSSHQPQCDSGVLIWLH